MSETLDATFTNLSQLSRAYGAPAVSLAERVVQKTAEGNILIGMILVVLGFIFLWATCFALGQSERNFPDRKYEQQSNWGFLGVLSFVVTLISWATSFSFLHDIWQWAALTDPQLALAHQVFGSMQRGY